MRKASSKSPHRNCFTDRQSSEANPPKSICQKNLIPASYVVTSWKFLPTWTSPTIATLITPKHPDPNLKLKPNKVAIKPPKSA